MTFIRFENASLGYEGKTILSAVDFRIDRGETVILVGPNGGGKTTLLRSVLGLLPLLSGSVTNEFKRTGYVPQSGNIDKLFPLSVEDLVQGGLPFPGGGGFPFFQARNRRKAIDGALARLELSHKRNKLLSECSGGELQKALIARGLVSRPDFLVMDEPVSSLDAGSRESFVELLVHIGREWGPAILMTDHHGLELPGLNRIMETRNGTIRVREVSDD